MDSNQLFAGFFFGLLGMGFFMFGKKSGRPIPLFTGLALMVVPYVIPNLIAMTIVCAVLCAVPWFVRTA